MSPNVEEFYNQFHSKRDGKFVSGGASSGRAGFREGSHAGSIHAKTHVPQIVSPYKLVTTRRPGKPTTHGGKGAATPENFPRGDKRVGPTHSKATNSAGARQAAHRQEAARQQDLRAARVKAQGGHVVTGVKLPLRNATTGRINPTQVRAAFKSTGVKSAGSKRTEKIGSTPVTSKTVKGRVIKHVATGGKPVGHISGANAGSSKSVVPRVLLPKSLGFRHASSHTKTVKAQRNILAEQLAKFKQT